MPRKDRSTQELPTRQRRARTRAYHSAKQEARRKAAERKEHTK